MDKNEEIVITLMSNGKMNHYDNNPIVCLEKIYQSVKNLLKTHFKENFEVELLEVEPNKVFKNQVLVESVLEIVVKKVGSLSDKQRKN